MSIGIRKVLCEWKGIVVAIEREGVSEERIRVVVKDFFEKLPERVLIELSSFIGRIRPSGGSIRGRVYSLTGFFSLIERSSLLEILYPLREEIKELSPDIRKNLFGLATCSFMLIGDWFSYSAQGKRLLEEGDSALKMLSKLFMGEEEIGAKDFLEIRNEVLRDLFGREKNFLSYGLIDDLREILKKIEQKAPRRSWYLMIYELHEGIRKDLCKMLYESETGYLSKEEFERALDRMEYEEIQTFFTGVLQSFPSYWLSFIRIHINEVGSSEERDILVDYKKFLACIPLFFLPAIPQSFVINHDRIYRGGDTPLLRNRVVIENSVRLLHSCLGNGFFFRLFQESINRMFPEYSDELEGIKLLPSPGHYIPAIVDLLRRF